MIDAEKSIIGCLMIYPAESEKVYYTLAPKMFELDKAKTVFSCCMQLRKAGTPVDVVTVVGKIGTEYAQFVKDCADTLPSLGGLDAYINLVQDGWRERTVIGKLNELAVSGMAVDDIIGELHQLLATQETIIQFQGSKTAKTFNECIYSFINWMGRPNTNIKTGWGRLDRLTGGLARKGCTAIVARPGNGKTTLGIQMATQMSREHSVYYQSMEMPSEQIMANIVSRAAKVDSNLIRDKKVPPESQQLIVQATEILHNSHRMIIDDADHTTLTDVEKNVERAKPDVVFIDHLGLITATEHKAKRNDELATLTRGLKQLAMKHNIAIVEMVQASRAAQEKKITMADMFGSATIEHDADMILAINPLDTMENGDTLVEVEVVKNRHGATGVVEMTWNKPTHNITELYDAKSNY